MQIVRYVAEEFENVDDFVFFVLIVFPMLLTFSRSDFCIWKNDVIKMKHHINSNAEIS
jgi:hypothetical protein